MSRSKNIKLHKEYGLNPTMCTCFYCGEETGEIALLGAAYKGEAPMHMCTSLEPCDKCKEKYKDYVLIVEADENSQPTPQIVNFLRKWVAKFKFNPDVKDTYNALG